MTTALIDLDTIPVLSPADDYTPDEFRIEPGVLIYFPDFIALDMIEPDGVNTMSVEGVGLRLRGIAKPVFFRVVSR